MKSIRDMVSLIGLVSLVAYLNPLNAQTFDWIRSSVPDNPREYTGNGTDVEIDREGRVFVTGYAQGDLNGDGQTDAFYGFLARYDAAGQLIWAEPRHPYLYLLDLTVEENNFVYVTGEVAGAIDRDGDGTNETQEYGESDFYLAKYDTDGRLIWARNAGLEHQSTGLFVDIVSSGSVFVAGSTLAGQIDFDGDRVAELNHPDFTYHYIVEYAPDGRFIRVFAVLGRFNLSGFAVDEKNNFYLSGNTGVQGFVNIDFDGDGTNEVTDDDDGNDLFVAKFNSSGELVWVRMEDWETHLEGGGLAIDQLGNIYLTGGFSPWVSSPGSSREPWFFFKKYDPDGQENWMVRPVTNGFGDDVYVDAAGNVFVSGYYKGFGDFNGDRIPDAPPSGGHPSYGEWNLFVARYSSDGGLTWFQTAGSQGFNLSNRGSAIGVASNLEGSVIITGNFRNSVDFTRDGTPDAVGGPENNYFLARYIPDETPPECELVEVVSSSHIKVSVQDAESGLKTVHVTKQTNATVSSDHFYPGFPNTVFVTATKIRPKKASVLELEVTDVAGNVTRCDPVLTTLAAEVPSTFSLEGNYPNPFNPSTTIRFQIAEPSHVTLTVYDVMGRTVARLVDEEMSAGSYAAEWDGRSDAGATVAGGIYFYRIEAGSFVETRAMSLVK